MIRTARLISVLALFLAGCAGDTPSPGETVREEAPAARHSYPAVTLDQEAATLGETVRTMGEEFPGGIVVMNGIQEKGLTPIAWPRKSYDAAVRSLAEMTESLVSFKSGYYFMYPEGYEALTTYGLAARAPQAIEGGTLAFNIGAGTAIYDALSLLSYHTRQTIIASNVVAEERSGEIALAAVSPVHAVEALLQSARLPESQLRISLEEGYVFIDAAGTAPRGPFRLDLPGTDAEAALLSKRVTATLPALPATVEGFMFYGAPAPLVEMLAELSVRCEVPITCAAALDNVPVNPCTFVDLPLGTVLDLLLRQWPVGGFGYEVDGDGVVIRPAG